MLIAAIREGDASEELGVLSLQNGGMFLQKVSLKGSIAGLAILPSLDSSLESPVKSMVICDFQK